MQHHGWLKKRSSGKIKSWRRFTLRVFYTLHSSFSLSFLLVHSSVRRYVLVDSTASLYYFDHECTSIENKNKIKGTRHLTSFFANVGALQNNLPKSSDVDRAFMFVTSDSRKPMMLVVADTIEEKNKWIEFLTDLFMREKLFDLQFLRESMFCNPSRQISSQLHYFPNQSTPFTIRRVNFPVNIFVMICLFVGDVHEAVSMKFVCRGWNACWKLFEPKILHWLVRFGQVEAGYRWKFWCHQLNITHGIDKASFARLIEQSTEFNQYEITKDVNRAFGTSTGKRMIERRSLAPLMTATTTNCWQEGHDEEADHTPRQYGRGRMDSIPEDDGSSLNSEDRQVTSHTLSSDEEVDERKENTGWGRIRSTQRWPATPETKKNSSNPRLFRRPVPAQIPEEDVQETDYLAPISEDDIQRKKSCLTSILRALSTRFDSVGYCQGMDRIVVHVMRAARCAVSLRSVPLAERPNRDQVTEERSRQCYSFLEAIFVRLSLSDIYAKEKVFGLRLKIYQMTRLLEVYCPELQQTLQNEGLSLEIFTIGWIQTLFLYVEAMPAETIDRIWDIFIVESSWVIIFQVAIAIIRLSTSSLHGKSLEVILEYFNIFPDSEILEADLLLSEACRIHITEEKLQHLQDIYFASTTTTTTKPPSSIS